MASKKLPQRVRRLLGLLPITHPGTLRETFSEGMKFVTELLNSQDLQTNTIFKDSLKKNETNKIFHMLTVSFC